MNSCTTVGGRVGSGLAAWLLAGLVSCQSAGLVRGDADRWVGTRETATQSKGLAPLKELSTRNRSPCCGEETIN